MVNDLMILTKYLILSGVLLAVFTLLLKWRVSYRLQRAVLLLTLPVSLLAAVISFDVFEVEEDMLWGTMIVEMESLSPDDAFVANIVAEEGVAYDDAKENVAQSSRPVTPQSDINWWIVVWGCVAAFLMLRTILGVGYIFRLRRLSDVVQGEGYSICRCGLVDSPFSFLRSVYINRRVDGEKFDLILQHELAHIHHLHYIDKIIIEILVNISWFNPLAWIIRNELCSVHEFEADSVVIKRCCDVKKYKQFIFDEASKSSPQIANGFNNSLIKQRFLEMQRGYQGKRYLMRKVLWALTVVVIISLSSFTYVVAEEHGGDDVVVSAKVESVQLLVEFKNGSRTVRKGSKGLREVNGYDVELIDSVMFTIGTNEAGYMRTSGKVGGSDNITKIFDYIKQGDYNAQLPFKMSPMKRAVVYPNSVSMTMVFKDGHEEVYRGGEINAANSSVDKSLVESTIFDMGNGMVRKTTYDDNYTISELLRNGEPHMVNFTARKNYYLEGGEVLVTLKSGKVKRFEGDELDKIAKIEPITIAKVEVNKPSTASSTSSASSASSTSSTSTSTEAADNYNSSLISSDKIVYEYSTTGTPTDERTSDEKRVKFYDLREDQTAVINNEEFKYGDIVAYRRDGYTEVDYIVPIFYSKQWFSHSSQTFIIDPKSGKRYQIQSVARNVPIDRYVRVIGQVGQTALFTMIFPPLPKGVKSIDILEYKIEGQPTPSFSSGSGPWLRKGVKVLDDKPRDY